MADEATTSDAAAQSQDDVEEPMTNDISGNTDAAQAEEAERQTEAADESEDTSQTSDSADTGPDEDKPDEDAEIKEWAAKKNLPLDDPLKIAKMYRESEAALGRKGAEEGKLKSAVDAANNSTGTEDVQALRNEVAALNFYITNPEAKQYEQAMVEILDNKPWLAGDLETVLLVAKGSAATDAEKLVAERQAGKKEALASVAQSERAAPPRASATTRTTSKEITDADIGNMTQAEYEAWKADGNDPFSVPIR